MVGGAGVIYATMGNPGPEPLPPTETENETSLAFLDLSFGHTSFDGLLSTLDDAEHTTERVKFIQHVFMSDGSFDRISYIQSVPGLPGRLTVHAFFRQGILVAYQVFFSGSNAQVEFDSCNAHIVNFRAWFAKVSGQAVAAYLPTRVLTMDGEVKWKNSTENAEYGTRATKHYERDQSNNYFDEYSVYISKTLEKTTTEPVKRNYSDSRIRSNGESYSLWTRCWAEMWVVQRG
jgi:hypothetical protein